MTRAAKHNGLDWRMFVALNEAVDELTDREDVHAVVLRGEGPSFCAGLDIESFANGDGDLSGAGLERAEGDAANFAQRVAYGWRSCRAGDRGDPRRLLRRRIADRAGRRHPDRGARRAPVGDGDRPRPDP